MKPKIFRAIGLMSGTSIDGIDAALIETDGIDYVKSLGFLPNPYEAGFRARLRQSLGNQAGRADPAIVDFERELTKKHAEIVTHLRRQLNGVAQNIDLIGFHGQTIWHQPKQATLQIGDGGLLARLTGIPVINDFRSNDVRAGGHGAPLVPLYHRALAAQLPKPVVILNIGGVSNITWIGGTGDDEILAFDIGPGNALIDDWVLAKTGQPFDEDGCIALTGIVQQALVDQILAMAFFGEQPPKSLDRNAFQHLLPSDLNAADGTATLTMISARAVAQSLNFVPARPKHIYVTGGGRLNKTLMRWIGELSGLPIAPVDDIGWSGDGLEAEAFAYLAVRSHLGLPLSLPGTTGVPEPMTGGTLHRPA